LGERLAAIASLVPEGTRLADIGTDHAYLPIELLQNNKIVLAVAGEINWGPYQAAQETIARLDLQHRISLRFGNGLAVLSPGEVDTVVIAGMGGASIIAILTAQMLVTQALNRLILQPMVAAAAVRRWLLQNNWRIVDEIVVEDETKLYEIIAAEPGVSQDIEPILYEIGPVLWAKKPPLLQKHIQQLIAQTERVLHEMAASSQAPYTIKYCEYAEKLRQLEAKRTCL
jgi:tRNA (adenine22-N1)-methyltransferase